MRQLLNKNRQNLTKNTRHRDKVFKDIKKRWRYIKDRGGLDISHMLNMSFKEIEFRRSGFYDAMSKTYSELLKTLNHQN